MERSRYSRSSQRMMNKTKKGPSALCGIETTAESLFLN